MSRLKIRFVLILCALFALSGCKTVTLPIKTSSAKKPAPTSNISLPKEPGPSEKFSFPKISMPKFQFPNFSTVRKSSPSSEASLPKKTAPGSKFSFPGKIKPWNPLSLGGWQSDQQHERVWQAIHEKDNSFIGYTRGYVLHTYGWPSAMRKETVDGMPAEVWIYKTYVGPKKHLHVLLHPEKARYMRVVIIKKLTYKITFE